MRRRASSSRLIGDLSTTENLDGRLRTHRRRRPSRTLSGHCVVAPRNFAAHHRVRRLSITANRRASSTQCDTSTSGSDRFRVVSDAGASTQLGRGRAMGKRHHRPHRLFVPSSWFRRESVPPILRSYARKSVQRGRGRDHSLGANRIRGAASRLLACDAKQAAVDRGSCAADCRCVRSPRQLRKKPRRVHRL